MWSSKFGHDARQVFAIARRYLRLGTRSTAEFRAYLQARHVSERLIDRLIAECSRRGLLDERSCAKLWATHLADRGYAWATIREQLLAKGLNGTLIAQVLRPLEARADDAARARELVHAQARGRDQRLRNRVARFLASRGFDSDLIDRVLTDSFGPVNIDYRD